MTDHRAWVHLHAEGTRRRNRGEEQRVAFIRGMDSVTRSFPKRKAHDDDTTGRPSAVAGG